MAKSYFSFENYTGKNDCLQFNYNYKKEHSYFDNLTTALKYAFPTLESIQNYKYTHIVEVSTDGYSNKCQLWKYIKASKSYKNANYKNTLSFLIDFVFDDFVDIYGLHDFINDKNLL